MTAPRGLGWLVDKADPRDKRSRDMLGAPMVAAKGRPDFRSIRGKRLLQGFSNACVSFAKARAIHMSMRLHGLDDPPYLSTRFDYAIARLQPYAGMAPEEVPALDDRGSYPRESLQATRKVGFLPDTADPFDEAGINVKPSPESVMSAFTQRGLTYYRIDEDGRARTALVETGMLKGVTWIFGTYVDRAYTEHQGPEPIVDLDTSQLVGRHMHAILAVEPDRIIVDNWWGDWGYDDGMGAISRELFESAFVSDVYGIIAAPFYA